MSSNPIRFDEQFTLEQFHEARRAVLGEGAPASPPHRTVSLKTRATCWGAGLAALSGFVLLLGGAPVAGRAITAQEHATPAPAVKPTDSPRSNVGTSPTAAAVRPVYFLTSEAAHKLPLSEPVVSF